MFGYRMRGSSAGVVEEGAKTYLASWRLVPQPIAAALARRAIRRQLAEWGVPDSSPVVELLVTELVTNAMRHAHGMIRFTLWYEEGLLRGEVEDANPEPPRLLTIRRDDERGRGLHLVERLSCCWGSTRTAAGKAVWFELPAVRPAPLGLA
jgi:hypothetical protein